MESFINHHLITNNALRGPLYREAVRRCATVLPYAPFAIYLDPCNACNLKCTFCAQSNGGSRERGLMKWELYEKAIQEVLELRPSRLFLFCYGEPTLHPDIGRMVKFAVNAGLNVVLDTNAAALTERKMRELIEGGLHVCTVSFDTADREEYNRMRVGSDFDRVLANIHMAVDMRDRLGRRNPRFILQEIVPYAKGMKPENSQAYRDLFKGYDVVFGVRFMHNYAGQGTEKKFALIQREGVSHCSQLYRRLVVNFDGKIHAYCLDPEGYNIVGDLTQGDTVAGAWNSPQMIKLRECTNKGEVSNVLPCNNCDQLTRLPHPSRSRSSRLLSSLLWQIAEARSWMRGISRT